MDYGGEEAGYIAGTPYLGADVKMKPGPGGFQGVLVAWDVKNAKPAWTIKEPPLPLYSGVLSTGGRRSLLRNHGRMVQSRRRAFGKNTLANKLASGIVGNPMTYVGPDGKQYVAIYAGIGGWMGAVALARYLDR